MRIAIVSRTTFNGGGASRVAADLCTLLNTVPGVEADHWVAFPVDPLGPRTRSIVGGVTWTYLQRKTQHVSRLAGFPDLFVANTSRAVRTLRKYDLIHLHDVQDVLSPFALLALGRDKPIVWTMHDCTPFTGGCMYPMDCARFAKRCGSCPQLSQWPLGVSFDTTRLILATKRRLYRSIGIVPITPSRWMAEQVEKSRVFAQRPAHIPYAVDSELFQPRDNNTVRELLGLPTGGLIVLASAARLDSPRKGFPHLAEAVAAFREECTLILLGELDEGSRRLVDNTDHRVIGYVRDKRLLAMYYSAADVLLFPTLADNLPMTILEAMACGTPTIGYRTGGVPDMITHLTNGYLASPGDVEGILRGLQRVTERSTRAAWSAAARDRALRNFGRKEFLKSHIDLYRGLL